MTAAPACFEPEPASVGAARRYAVGLLQDPTVSHLHDDIRTVVSELATNAVLHARTPFTITVLVDAASVRVAVSDASPGRPRLPRLGDLSGTTGRGLRIVAQLSADWGVDVHDDGKTTWCLLPATAPSGPATRQQDDTEAARPAPTEGREAGTRRSSHGPADASSTAASLAGEEILDEVAYELPGSAAAFVQRIADLLAEVETWCSSDAHLLTLAPPPDVAAYRRWSIQEVLRQHAGAAPRPWTTDASGTA